MIDVEDDYGSPYYELSGEERAEKISNFFANKIKQIIKIEKEDNYTSDAKNIEWKRDCEAVSEYMGYDEKITVKDCYRVYDKLKSRKDRIKESRKSYKAKVNIRENKIDDNARTIGEDLEEYVASIQYYLRELKGEIVPLIALLVRLENSHFGQPLTSEILARLRELNKSIPDLDYLGKLYRLSNILKGEE